MHLSNYISQGRFNPAKMTSHLLFLVLFGLISGAMTKTSYQKCQKHSPSLGPRVLSCQLVGLTELPDVPPSVAEQYEILRLHGNLITHLPPGRLSAFKNLRVLNLGSNLIRNLSKGAFTGLEKLERLVLLGNNISRIDKDTFADLSNLTQLDLFNNRLTRFSSDSFGESKNLKELWLGKNKLSVIEDTTFSRLENLVSLDLQKNQLERISKHAFAKLKKLRYLGLKAQASHGKLVLSLETFSNFIHKLKDKKFPQIQVDISADNLNCTCEMSWLLHKIHTGNLPEGAKFPVLNFGFLNPATCGSNDMKNKTFYSVLQKKCRPKYQDCSPYIDQWSGLVTLNCSSRKFMELPKIPVPDAYKYHKLDFSKNYLRSIPPGSFSAFTNLTVLNLDFNLLSNLSDRSFEGLEKLTSLNLFKNLISNISRGLFKNFASLEFLDFGHNTYRNLTPGVFSDLKNLARLYLRVTHLEEIRNGTFANLSNLKDLSLAWSHISKIESGAFHGLHNLRALELHGNNLKEVSHGTFRDLKDLGALGIGWNEFTAIESGTFSGLSSLALLNMNNNYLESIAVDAIRNLKALNYLDISNQRSSGKLTLPLEMFTNFIGKTKDFKFPYPFINIAQNNLNCTCKMNWLVQLVHNHQLMDGSIIPALQYDKVNTLGVKCSSRDIRNRTFALNLTRRCASYEECFTYGTKDYYILDCSNVGFQQIPSQPPLNTEKYKSIKLGYNFISVLPKGIFSAFKNLITLDLRGNQIQVIENGTFDGVHHIMKLNLEQNFISSIEKGALANLRNLQHLNLRRNRLSTISENTFASLSNLKFLYLGNNQINEVGHDTFSCLKSLEILDLAANRISAIESTDFSGVYNLESLYLQENYLITISKNAFSNLSNLTKLDLSSQRSKGQLILQLQTFETFMNYASERPKILLLNISYNDLRCTCKLSWLIYMIHRRKLPDKRMMPALQSRRNIEGLTCSKRDILIKENGDKFLKRCRFAYWPFKA